jgi:hypothetical protein
MSKDYDLNETGEVSESMATVPAGALESITRGEIDMQIATAKKYPRDLAQFKKRSLQMVSMDEETAESCIYRRPVGQKDGKMQYAEGLSVRMAEIVASCYGNIRAGAMLIEQTPERVIARGFCHDVENNVAMQSEAVEGTVGKNGKPFSPGMRIVIAKAALAKARRDAVFQVVPRAMVKFLENEARRIIAGDATTIAARAEKAVAWVRKLNIDERRVWAALGVAIAGDGFPELDAASLEELTGLRTSIKEGDVSLDDAFPMNSPNDGKDTGDKTKGRKERKPPGELQDPAQHKATPTADAELLPRDNGASPKDIIDKKLTDANISDEIFVDWVGQVLDKSEAGKFFADLKPATFEAAMDAWERFLKDIGRQ